MNELKQDLALAVRRLLQAPGLTVSIIATLALGIGLTTAVFAIVHAVVLRPLPFREPDRLVIPGILGPDGSLSGLSFSDFLDVQARNHSFEHIAVVDRDQFTLRGPEDVERIPGAWVTSGYFPALGLEPVLGRLFSPAEADRPGAPVALLGYDLWQRRFRGDPRIVGRAIELDQIPLTVVGVLPPGFHGLDSHTDVFVPVAILERLRPRLRQLGLLQDPELAWGALLGRLAPGVGRDEALADLRSLFSKAPLGLAGAREVLEGDLRPQLLRLLGASSFVLLISCASVGHLLLTRAAGRHRETAVRAALGATRGQLVRHGWIEGLLLGIAGGAAGLPLAGWSLDLLLAVTPLDVPAAFEIRIDGAVLAFALSLSLVAGGLAALAPALHSAWPDLAGSLKQGGRGASESLSSRRTRSLLVAVDVALALMLLIGAGLMVRSLERIRRFDPGFQGQGILTLSFEPPTSATAAERVRIKQEILRQTSLLPGVRSAALTSQILFDVLGRLSNQIASVEKEHAQVYYVSSGFFRTLGISLEAGHDFVSADHRPPVRVAIVNRTFVNRHLAPGDPVGQQLSFAERVRNRYQVIGVVEDVRTTVEPGEPVELPQVYLPGLENAAWGFSLAIAAEGDPMALVAPVRRTIRRISADTVVFNVTRLDTRVANATSDTRFFTGLMGVCAGTALALAVLAIYSLVVSMIQREARDIAVRRALGAGSGAILRLVLARALPPVLLGTALGLGGAFLLARTLSAVLFDIEPLDPATFLLAPLLFAAAALAACLSAAQRALEIEPMAALQE